MRTSVVPLVTNIRPDEPSTAQHHSSMLMVSTIAPTLGFVIPFARHLRRSGWRVEAAANGTTSMADLEGVFDSVHEVPLSRSMLDIRGITKGWRAITGVLRSGDYDIVHVHTPIAAFVVRAAIRLMPAAQRPSVVYTAHGFHFHQGGGRVTNAVFLTMEKVAGRWTDRLIVINDEDYAAARRHHIVPSKDLVLMPGIGVDTSWYQRSAIPGTDLESVRASIGVDRATPLFVVIGELSVRKRPFDVVAALGQMQHADAHLLVVGEGPEQSRVLDVAMSAGVTQRVHLMGSIQDIRPLVLASNALVLASSREGLPRAILEALSMGVVVVTTDARGNPDLVSPDAGTVVAVGDIPALAKAMDGIIDDPVEAQAMGARGRARMVASYDLRIVIDLHYFMYDELLSERVAQAKSFVNGN